MEREISRHAVHHDTRPRGRLEKKKKEEEIRSHTQTYPHEVRAPCPHREKNSPSYEAALPPEEV